MCSSSDKEEMLSLFATVENEDRRSQQWAQDINHRGDNLMFTIRLMPDLR